MIIFQSNFQLNNLFDFLQGSQASSSSAVPEHPQTSATRAGTHWQTLENNGVIQKHFLKTDILKTFFVKY